MADQEEYRFRIAAYSPDTIPMARLAEYMAHLATLMGQPERVHFVALEAGSTQVVSRVEREAVPKVRERLAAVAANDAPDDARDAFTKLDKLLYADNAVGVLQSTQVAASILKFPGIERVVPDVVGPFWQATQIEGVLIRVGGKDRTAHALIELLDGRVVTCEVSRELARSMAQHLFGPPLRINGEGRFLRDSDGVWQTSRIKAATFDLLSGRSLADALSRLRAVGGNRWSEMDDPLAEVRKMQDDDHGLH